MSVVSSIHHFQGIIHGAHIDHGDPEDEDDDENHDRQPNRSAKEDGQAVHRAAGLVVKQMTQSIQLFGHGTRFFGCRYHLQVFHGK